MSYTASYIVNSSSAQGTTDFQFTFPYIKEEHIEVYLNYNKITQGSGSAQYQVITNVSPKLIRLNTGITSANLRVEVRRNSSLGSPLVDYADGSTLTANDLDTSALQSLYIDQELKDNQSRTVVVDETTGLPELNNQRLTNVADPTAAQDVVTKAYLERAGSINSTQILDGTILNVDINASAAISGSKLQLASGSNPGALSTSDFIKLGNIDAGAKDDQTAAEIRVLVGNANDSNVFTDALKNKLDGCDTGAKDDQTAAEIRVLVGNANDSNVFTDADHSKLDGIDTGAKDDQTAAEIKSLIATSPLDASHLAANSVGDSEIVTGALDNRYYTETEADARFYNLSSGEEIQSGETWSAADNKIATTAAIDARIIDLVDDVGGFVPIANETSFPAANPDVNNGAGTLVSVKAFASSHTPSSGSVTIANGAGSGNTVTITGCGSTVLAAGFGGIVETTSTLHTYTFHRLTPKATEVTTVAGNITNINAVNSNSANINTVAGNSSNINTVAGISANVTTVAGISSNVTSVAGNSSNINSVNSNSSNINTVAGAISNVNTVGGAIANVNTVASNMSTVNDFGARYRVASADPTSNNDEGDLVFNTTSNELRVYNGSSWQGGVTATGNLAGLGANTFTGAQTFADDITLNSSTSGRVVQWDKSEDTLKFGIGLGIELEDNSVIRFVNGLASQTSPPNEGLMFGASGSEYLKIYNDTNRSNIIGGVSGGVFISGTRVTLDGDVYTDDDFYLTGADGNILWDKSETSLKIDDDVTTYWGDGADLQIEHFASGSLSRIYSSAAGGLDIKIVSGALRFKSESGGSEQTGATYTPAAGWSFGHAGAARIATDAAGVDITGQLDVDGHVNLGDSDYLQLGDHQNLQLGNNGTNNFIQATGDLLQITTASDHPIQLKHSGSIKLATSSTGIAVTGGLTVSGDLQVNGTTTTVASSTMTVADKNIEIAKGAANDAAADGGGITLESGDGNKTITWVNATDSWTFNQNIATTHHVNLVDTGQVRFGGSQDLLIYHSTHNYIDSAASQTLFIRSSQLQITSTDGGETLAKFIDDGAVELYENGTKRAETTTTGFNVVGALTVNGSPVAGGNTIELVADGAIAAGKPVIIKTNGKAKQAGIETTSLTTPTFDGSDSIGTGSHGCNQWASDPYNVTACWTRTYGVCFVAYNDKNGNPDNMEGALTKPSSSATCSNRVDSKELIGNWPSSNHRDWKGVDCAYDIVNNKVMLVGKNDGTGKPAFCKISITADDNMSTSNGYTNLMESTGGSSVDAPCKVVYVGSGRFATFFSHSSSNEKVTCRIATWNGTNNYTLGTAVDLPDRIYNFVATWHEASGKIVFVGQQAPSGGLTNPTVAVGEGFAMVGTISGTGSSATTSWATHVAFPDDKTTCGDLDIITDDETDKIVIIGRTANGNNFSSWVGSLSGTTLTLGNAVEVDSISVTDALPSPIRVVYHDGQKKVIASYASNDEQSHYLKIGTVSTSSNTITWANRTQWASANGNQWVSPVVAYGNSSGTLLANFSWSNAGGRGLTRQFKYTSQATNITTSSHNNVLYSCNVLGFAEDAISDGNTGTIKLPGNVVGNQSGLSAGTFYYYQADGTLGTSEDNSIQNLKAGVAISSSKLVVGDPNRL